jgi:hypothetical protein
VVLATLRVLPSLTPSLTPTLTLTPSATPSVTGTFTATATAMPGATEAPDGTLMPTALPVLRTRVLEISAIMPGVAVPALDPAPEVAAGVRVLPAPPLPIEPLPDATSSGPVFGGWMSYESDHPAVRYAPAWTARLSPLASRGQYHRTEAGAGRAQFVFEGEGVRVRYVAAQNMGEFAIVVDGVVVDTIDAYAEQLMFPGSGVYFVGAGRHVLEIQGNGRKNAASEGYVIGLDALQVYRAEPDTQIVPPVLVTRTAAPTPRPAARIELVGAPPTVQPTWTPVAPRVLEAAVVIAYDENGNRSVDPAEGVAGIPVRVVEISSNRVIASGLTDARGYVAFEVVSDVPARIVAPYFGQAWELTRGGGGAPAYMLLLKAGNQPGLIP